MASEVLPKLNRTLYVWATNDLSNLDPSVVPAGSVFNMYTDLGSTLNTTAVRGVPAILSAPYCEIDVQAFSIHALVADLVFQIWTRRSRTAWGRAAR